MKLQANEIELRGDWILVDGRVDGDATCKRIQELIATHLQEVATSSCGWKTLFRDPEDGRFWERTYPQSELHGGGPPCLTCIDHLDASKKYSVTAV